MVRWKYLMSDQILKKKKISELDFVNLSEVVLFETFQNEAQRE